MKKQVHVVPHMHWDREWYFTTEESRILLVNNMKEILERLENDVEYKYYVMDGQTAILEDYFAVCPENKERVKALVQAGKLIIGPWYSQTDEVIVNGESIARNLLYGIKDCQPFGEPMMIGYLPDSFGQSEQMPQILNEFDITRSLFWRGVSELHGTDKTEFIWQAPEGSQVMVQIFPLGYAIGKYLPNDKTALEKRLGSYLQVLEKGATSEHLILPNGHDQMPIQQDIFEIMDKLNEVFPDKHFFMSKYEHIFEALEKNYEQDKQSLDLVKGEFLDGKYMRIHRSISSTRMDIKIAHAEFENKMTNILEPLASMAYSLGFDYHHGLIERMWKEALKNHAHDSIGCCCSDAVHREVLARFFIAHDMADNLIKFYMRKITDATPNKAHQDKVVLFNLLPYEKSDIADVVIRIRAQNFSIFDAQNQPVAYTIKSAHELDPGLIDRQIVHYGNYDPFMEFHIQIEDKALPAMGYRTYYIKGNDQSSPILAPEAAKKSDHHVLENEFYKVDINPNGTLEILDKKLNKQFTKVLQIEEGSDDGDEYDFSPLENDWLIRNDEIKADIKMQHTAYESIAHIQFKLAVPQDLASRKAHILDAYVDFNIKVSLKKAEQYIHFSIDMNNQAKDHRVRVLIPTTFASQLSISDHQFGSIKRPVVDPAMKVWQAEDWKEMPVSIYSMMTYVALESEKQGQGVALLTKAVREYEIVGDDFDTIAITLFRSVGLLGKENLYYRPGRPSGIKLPTPDSQMIGKICVDLAFQFYQGDYISAKIPQSANQYVTPTQFYNQIPFNAMKLNLQAIQTPLEYSLLSLNQQNVVLSTLKKAETSNELVLRVFNPSREMTAESMDFKQKYTQLTQVKLSEKAISVLEAKDSKNINLGDFKPCQVKSFAFKLGD